MHEDRLFVADLDMNDSCVLWEALYETSDDQPGSSLSNGEFIVLIKPIAYGAKDKIQIILRDQSKIQGDYNLHKGNTVTSISPGSVVIDGVHEMFKSPCDYNNFINTKTVNNGCESNAFVITGNSTNLTHPFY